MEGGGEARGGEEEWMKGDIGQEQRVF